MAGVPVMKRVFSGIQPTGVPHLGNYIGAVRQWVRLQNQMLNESAPREQAAALPSLREDPTRLMLCAVDLHALTAAPKPDELRANVVDMIASLLACGLDPNHCVLYQQSSVPQHCELSWILTCLTPMGRLSRMTQFKDKSKGKAQDQINLGLFAYPVLMAADILLFNATHVPVGNDQQQHLELARSIAITFNSRFEGLRVEAPEPIFDRFPRVMSLRDPSNKMSKSDPHDASRVLLSDEPDTIWQKIKKAKTDSIGQVSYDPDERPGVANLLRIHAALLDQPVEDSVAHFQAHDTLQFKKEVSDVVVEHLGPISKRRREILESGEALEVMRVGAERARELAQANLDAIKRQVGFL